MGYNDVYISVWQVVDAINSCETLKITFPNHEEQALIASRFEVKSTVGFDNCCGCIDGLLIWTNKPTKLVLEKAKLGRLFFQCRHDFCEVIDFQNNRNAISD